MRGRQSLSRPAVGLNIVFRPAAGARVVLGGLTFGSGGDGNAGPDRITVRGMHTSYKRSRARCSVTRERHIRRARLRAHITLVNLDAGSVDSWFAHHLTVQGGDYWAV